MMGFALQRSVLRGATLMASQLLQATRTAIGAVYVAVQSVENDLDESIAREAAREKARRDRAARAKGPDRSLS